MPNITSIFSENADTRSLAPAAVGSQVLLMTVVSVRLSKPLLAGVVIQLILQVITIIFFNFLRPKNKASALTVTDWFIHLYADRNPPALPLDRLRAQSQVSCR
jgi:hypothetical protein